MGPIGPICLSAPPFVPLVDYRPPQSIVQALLSFGRGLIFDLSASVKFGNGSGFASNHAGDPQVDS